MKPVLLAATLAISGGASAQTLLPDGTAFGQPESEIEPVLVEQCQEVIRHALADTTFPVAETSEVHLQCTELALAGSALKPTTVYTFADDALVMIEARGAGGTLAPAPEPEMQMDGFEIYPEQGVVINRESDQTWYFGDLNLANLFIFWDNPVWDGGDGAVDSEWFLPSEAVWGESAESVMAALREKCRLMQHRPIDEVWLRTAPAEQQQVDCYGYEIAGYPRKLEFVFGDDQLQQIWLMFGAADIARTRDHFSSEFGAPVHVGDILEAFEGWHVAIRKDIPEILMLSPREAELWERDGY